MSFPFSSISVFQLLPLGLAKISVKIMQKWQLYTEKSENVPRLLLGRSCFSQTYRFQLALNRAMQSVGSGVGFPAFTHRACLSILSTRRASHRAFSRVICSWISNSSSSDRVPCVSSWLPACRTFPTLLWCAVSSIMKACKGTSSRCVSCSGPT